jgi:hypothetical protein
MRVAILGASAKPDRYSYLALRALLEKGHQVFPVNPTLPEIEGIRTYPSLADLPDRVDTITVYLAPQRSRLLARDIIDCRPRRVVFNPGAVNRSLMEALRAEGIEATEACTLVMLSLGSF